MTEPEPKPDEPTFEESAGEEETRDDQPLERHPMPWPAKIAFVVTAMVMLAALASMIAFLFI